MAHFFVMAHQQILITIKVFEIGETAIAEGDLVKIISTCGVHMGVTRKFSREGHKFQTKNVFHLFAQQVKKRQFLHF